MNEELKYRHIKTDSGSLIAGRSQIAQNQEIKSLAT
jgi:hypothetical protein